ncbi:HAD family hydrolase [bacterium]|nr:HAD family hydrolase [bacterium]
MLKVILWDVGGPLLDEDEFYVLWERGVRTTAAETLGREISDAEFEQAKEWAIQSYAPYTFRAMLYELVGRDEPLHGIAVKKFYAAVPWHSDTLQPGIKDLLCDLSPRVPMTIVANQLKGVAARLDELGIAQYFKHIVSAGEFGLSKPDLRIYQHALGKLGVTPEEALMVGDRQDNDVVPAKMLGIKTLLLRQGWYKNQKVRVPEEQADWTVKSVPEMITKLRDLFP